MIAKKGLTFLVVFRLRLCRGTAPWTNWTHMRQTLGIHLIKASEQRLIRT
jgi:hypothetical protein